MIRSAASTRGRYCIVRGLCIGLASVVFFSEPVQSATQQTYDFKVFLGQREIGRQRFDVSSEGERTQVRVDAQFTVTFLSLPVYTYRHTNVETWEGACLREIRTTTNDNGEAFFVNGTFGSGQLMVQTQATHWRAEGCIKTFAYWNPEWIAGEQLLNAQTGELLRVSLRSEGDETIAVQGVPMRTSHRRIITDTFAVDLWYTIDGRWVALQSTTKKGDTLRYLLQ